MDVTPNFGYVHDEAMPLPKHLSLLPPINADIQLTRWEDGILWSDPEDEESDEDEEEEEEDEEGEKDKDKDRIPLLLDLNDPAMLYEAGVMRPQRLWEVIIQQNKGRHRIANWKLERIASMLSEQKLANQRGESRFNLSNDQVRARGVGEEQEWSG